MEKSGFEKHQQDSIMNEMKSGDYINLLRTFEKYFGSVYNLQTSNPEYLDHFMVEKNAKEIVMSFMISTTSANVTEVNQLEN